MSHDLEMSTSQPALHAVYTPQAAPAPVSEIALILAGSAIAVLGIIGAASTARLVGPTEIFLGSIAGVVTGVAITMSAVVLRRLRQISDCQREQGAHFDDRLTHSKCRQDMLAEQLLNLTEAERDLLETYGDQLGPRRDRRR